MGGRWAVTGGIATGKSTVLEMFRQYGLSVLSADQVVADLWQDPVVGAGWARALRVAYPVDRTVLRQKLTDHAFRQQVSEIIQPKVLHHLMLSTADIVEIPVLFEACLTTLVDRVVVTTCTSEQQIVRLTKRMASQGRATELISTQLASEIKVAFADYVVDTSGTKEDTRKQVESIASAY